jgi:hypothetical protein
MSLSPSDVVLRICTSAFYRVTEITGTIFKSDLQDRNALGWPLHALVGDSEAAKGACSSQELAPRASTPCT